MSKAKVAKKIKNLLNKTIENGSPETEVMAAAALAQKLMLAHDISDKDLEELNAEVLTAVLDKYSFKPDSWVLTLVRVLSENFKCKVVYQSVSGKKKINLV